MKKRTLACIFAALLALSLAACGDSSSGEENSTSPSETLDITPEPTENSSIPESTPPTESSTTMSLDDLCSLIKGVIEDSYSGCTVTHDENMVKIRGWVDGVAADIMGGSANVKDDWNALIESLKKLSNGTSSLIETAGYEGVSSCFYLLNDLNHENVLLAIMDGVVIYDVMDETPEPTSAPTPTETVTMGQRNALSKANQYLSIMAFSYSGLINQLEFEGYTTDEATYGADNCGADWNEQAAKKAQQYIDIMSFSKQGLIDQLKYDGFTQAQAEYGVSAVGY